MSTPQRPRSGAIDVVIPTNPLAALSCWIGIGSMLLCAAGPLLGPIAIFLGWLGLKKWKHQESAYGAATSKIRAWIGIVTGVLGTVVGAVVLVSILSQR